MDISKLFKDKDLKYYLHGTGGEDIDSAISILKNGLHMWMGGDGLAGPDTNIHTTALPLGCGSETLYNDKACEQLNNYGHKNSRYVVVISLPRKYLFNFDYDNAAVPFMEERLLEELTKFLVLMPEFVAGFYDAGTKTFFHNKKYFKNLPKEQQDEVFNKVHNNYVNSVKEYFDDISYNKIPYYFRSVEGYLERCKSYGAESPLTKGDITELKAYVNKMLKLRKEKGLPDFSEMEQEEKDFDERFEKMLSEDAERMAQLDDMENDSSLQYGAEYILPEEDLTRVHSWEDVDWDDDVM